MGLLSPEEISMIARDSQDVIGSLGGQMVQVQTSIRTECTVCGGVDPDSRAPRNPLCVTCEGTGYQNTITPVGIPAVVEWAAASKLQRETVGRVDYGKCTLDVAPQWESYFREGTLVTVHGRSLEVVGISPSGIGGRTSRIIIQCEKKVV
jgi:hypothetical protein